MMGLSFFGYFTLDDLMRQQEISACAASTQSTLPFVSDICLSSYRVLMGKIEIKAEEEGLLGKRYSD